MRGFHRVEPNPNDVRHSAACSRTSAAARFVDETLAEPDSPTITTAAGTILHWADAEAIVGDKDSARRTEPHV